MLEEDKAQTDTITNESEFWSMYPQNVHLATTASSGGGFSLQNKKIIATFGFVGLTIVITIIGYYVGNKYNLGLLGAVVALVVGILISLLLYTRLLRDKFNEDFESDTQNKILKLFRIRLNDVDREEKVGGVATLMSYTSGDIFVTMRIEIGNSNPATEAITAELLDKIFKSTHQLKLGFKNFNTRSEWRKSDVHHNHLKRLTKVTDEKLKATLAGIDSYQSEIFDNSEVIAIHLMFVTKKHNRHSLDSLVNMIEDWRKDYFYMSSIRTLDWLDKDQTVKAMCDFLTIKMLDVTSSLSKANVKYDVRKLVRVFSPNRFRPSEDVEVETKAAMLRKRKGR